MFNIKEVEKEDLAQGKKKEGKERPNDGAPVGLFLPPSL